MTADYSLASQNDLLLHLQNAVGCSYMSDLHLPVFHSLVKEAVLGIDAANYSAAAWNAALHYITGGADPCADAAEARAQLIARLDQPID